MDSQLTEADAINKFRVSTDQGTIIEIEVQPFYKETQFYVNGKQKVPLFTLKHIQAMLFIGSIDNDRDIYDVIKAHISTLRYGIDYITVSGKEFRREILRMADAISEHNCFGEGSLAPHVGWSPLDHRIESEYGIPMYLFTAQGVAQLAASEEKSVQERIKDKFDEFIPVIQRWYRDYLQVLDDWSKVLREYPIPYLGDIKRCTEQ